MIMSMIPVSDTKTAKKIKRLVIIGAGMAGTRFATQFATQKLEESVNDKSNYEITLINQEPYAGYNRIMLSPVLAGEKTFEDIVLHSFEEYSQLGIALKTHTIVESLDTQGKQLVLQSTETGSKEHIDYDELVFATGSTPFILPIENNDAKGVFSFRTKADVDDMLNAIKGNEGHECIVIGAGLLGLEAANALANHGANVTVVHTSGHILNRQLDPTAASILQDYFEQKGIHFELNARSEQITTDEHNKVTGLNCQDGRYIPANSIIMTVGVRPNIDLAKSSSIECDKGILVNEFMQTSTQDVYAIGECIQFQNQLFGLVAPAYEQANILIQSLSGKSQAYSIKPEATKLKVAGVDLFSAGEIAPPEDIEPAVEYILYEDASRSIYKKLIIQDKKLIGAILYGDVTDGSWFFELIDKMTNIEKIRANLIFGENIAYS